MTPKSMRRAAAIVAVGAFLAASCGGDSAPDAVASLEDPATTTSAPAGPEVSMEEGLIAFTQCLREQGLEVEDPTVGLDGSLQLPPIQITSEVGDGSTDPDVDAVIREMEAVMADCDALLGDVAFTSNELPGSDDFLDKLVEYAGCMRDNGVDMPDPDLFGGGGVIDLGGDPTDPAFAAADEACREILGGIGPLG